MWVNLPIIMETCAPNIGQATLYAIIRTESGGYPWAIGDNTARLTRQPATKKEAIAIAKKLILAGHNIDLGLAQINYKNLTTLGLTIDQVFEPCTNLSAAAIILANAYSSAVKQYGQSQWSLLVALSAYNTGNHIRGFTNGYVQKVAANAGIKSSTMTFNFKSKKSSK